MRYRKKPVEIEAMRWDGGTKSWQAIVEWSDGRVTFPTSGDRRMEIHTLEGVLTVSPGDWVIRGVKGEFYPCKPDIFEETYEPV